MAFNEESQRLWSSRVSFGIALAALTGMVYSGCGNRAEHDARPSAESRPENGNATVVERAQTPPSSVASPAADTPSTSPASSQPDPAPQAKLPVVERGNEAPSTKASAEHALVIKRLVVTQAIEEREPVAAEALLAGPTPVFAFVELENPSSEDQKIVITFEHESGKRVGFVELEIPKEQKRWRTWGQTKNIASPGSWTAIVATPAGAELGRTTFDVGPAASSSAASQPSGSAEPSSVVATNG